MSATILGSIAAAILIAAGWITAWRTQRRLRSVTAERDAVRAQNAALGRLASAGRVAGGLAHELGNPLCAITNYAHSLEPKVAPELRPTLHSLQREAARMQRMTDGMIEHVRPRQPGADGADVNVALRESLSFLGEQGVLRRITVNEHLDDAPLPVRGTAIELEQAFANLVLNAVDAMPGGGTLALWTKRLARSSLVEGALRRSGDDAAYVTSRRDGRIEAWLASQEITEAVKIVVADSGHGVAHGHEERIFEPFVTTKETAGTGLGLSIVRGIVHSMGGIVWVQRSREGGAAFHIVLAVHTPASESARR
ncbi:MAG TPA: ATP-binding protein [Gemmatimonadaceae bacterium]|jgi:signal transduction histidine kinase